MRQLLPLLLVCALPFAVTAQDGKTNSPASTGITIPASAGTITAPFTLTNGYLYQPEIRAELVDGSKATFDFTITNGGEYVIHAIVNAPGEDSNSFFVNIDNKPEDPMMIWDIEPTSGFEERAVSWRGDGADGSNQFPQKKFRLSPGKHQLLLYAREPDTQLKSLSIRPAKAN